MAVKDTKYSGNICAKFLHIYKLIRQAWTLAKEYGNNTTIHGLDRILAKRLGMKQRLIWTVVFVLAVGVLISVGMVLSMRYNRKQFQTVIDTTNYEIYKIPFPEIVVCNVNRFNWSRFPEAELMFLKQQHYQEPFRSAFAFSLIHFDTLSYGKFDRFKQLASLETTLQQLDYINITAVVNFLSWRCEEVLSDCWWSRKQYNCCDIFLPRPSPEGNCLSFNNIVTDAGKRKQLLDDKWPWRTSGSGPERGLKVELNLHLEHHAPQNLSQKGTIFFVLEPGVWWNDNLESLPNTLNSVSMKGILHYYDSYTRRLSSAERACVFEDEFHSVNYKTLPGQTYMKENCLAVCAQEYLIKYCNCTLDYFYPTSNLTGCRLPDILCLAKYNDIIRRYQNPGEAEFIRSFQEPQCDCLLNCHSLTYVVDHRPVPYSDRQILNNNNESIVSFEFFFKDNFMLVFRTSLIYTWVDLLVSFGGISALFLGCSFISLLELGYFLLIRLPLWFWQKRCNQQNFQRRKSQECINNLLIEFKHKSLNKINK